ncbi:pseudouridine synthase [Pseudodonghicola xiamenensis]|uniref:Pseudouridine synthase n=1 Tax=Pseudodonghicola xiamenensis TaxID=337702 RepID=A0A8J3MCV3_9RHOB|nr:pseudouridine synthase [Pseudodonghicola xiamenensis]GHG91612.1 hypothetical protein GCM10010961_23010 [Pseudodonghicola xiamenensis]
MSKAPVPPAPEGDRIAKVLARAGVASRREAERMIEEGRVNVNGKPIDSPALNVTAKDRISVDGKPLAAPEPARLWLYHKPSGLVTTARDEQGRETIFDALPEEMPRVMSVGRLDLNSEGLLLLTNDGGLKRQLELPSTGWLRRYRVRINGRPEEKNFEPLRQGVVIEGEKFQPMIVSIDRQQGANAWLTVGLREGRNREIRRAMEAVGFSVNRLIRISYGPFQLGNLKAGEVEEVRRRVLRDQLGLEAEVEDAAGGTAKPRPRRGGKPGDRPQARGGDKPQRKTETGTGKRPSRGDKTSEAAPGDRPARKFTAKPGAKPWEKSGGPRDTQRGDRPERGAKPAGSKRLTRSAKPGVVDETTGTARRKFTPKSGAKPEDKPGSRPTGPSTTSKPTRPGRATNPGASLRGRRPGGPKRG